jgi:hypothetical protein
LAAEAAPGTAQALAEIMPHAKVQTLRASTHDLPAAEIAAAITPFFTNMTDHDSTEGTRS